MPVDGCMRRAARVLQMEGYTVATSDAETSEPAQREAERLQRRMEQLSRDRGFDRNR